MNIRMIALGLALCGSAQANIIFQATPPANVPATAPLVQVFPSPVSRDTLTRRASAFGLTGTPTFLKTPVGLAVQYTSPASGITFLVQQNQFGSDFYADLSKYMVGQAAPNGPISDPAATTAANAFVQQYYPSLLRESPTAPAVMHLMEQSQDLSTGQLLPAIQSESIVTYSRTFAGIPVVGPGDGAKIHVANTAQVTGSQVVWRRLVNTGKSLNLLGYSAVQGNLIGLLNQQLGDGHENAVITKIEFGYYSRPENQPQGWYQPCYLFHVSFNDPRQQMDTGGVIIPIADIDSTQMREALEFPQTQPTEGDPAHITINATPPTIPSTAPIFQVTPTTVNVDSLSLRSSKLGFTSSRTVQTPRGLMSTDSTGRLALYMDKNGAEMFAHTDRLLEEPPGEAQPISDAVATRLATDWIAASGDMPSAQLGTPIVQHLFHQTFDIQNQKPGTMTQDETILLFHRQLQDPKTQATIPILGQGEFVQVHVDNLGNVTGHHRVWRNLSITNNTSVPTRPYQDILLEFQRKLQSELGGSNAVVRNIQFGFYARGEGFSQGYLQPCLLFDVGIPNPVTGQITGNRSIPVAATNLLLEPLDDPDAGDNPAPTSDPRAADAVPSLFGDLNGDGKVDTTDVLIALQVAGGLSGNLTPAQVGAGDVAPAGSPDAAIRMDDALRLIRSLFGLDSIANG